MNNELLESLRRDALWIREYEHDGLASTANLEMEAVAEIERLYKMLATERALVDQLAEILDRVGEHRCPLTCPTCISLNAWKKERHE
jgi:hypothetical protein